MPPKGANTKADQKKKQKIIEDKTFGLKNKNKSKAVQKFVQSVANNVTGGNNPEARRKQAELDARKKAKEEKLKYEAEMNSLFREVKTKKTPAEEAAEAAAAAAAGEVKVYDEVTGEYLWQPEDFAEVEKNEQRLEEVLEEELAAIRARPPSELTRVTPETFAIWKKQKKEEQEAAMKAAYEKQLALYQKKGHGISGRTLWQHDATLFVDDDDAQEADEYVHEEEEEQEAQEVPVDASLFAGGDEDLPEEDS